MFLRQGHPAVDVPIADNACQTLGKAPPRRLVSSASQALLVAAALLGCCVADTRAADPPAFTFQQPEPPPDAATVGSKIQRAMRLLATSTPEQRNHVRVLFYGQSISRQSWTKEVEEYLRKTYPHADIEAANLSRGGHTAPWLIHTAEFDLYPYYPDLLIFHVYGGDDTGELEAIIRRTRQRTTADILIWTPHLRFPRELPRDTLIDHPEVQKGLKGDDHHAERLREIAAKYDCELADTRKQWKKYLKQHDLSPKDMVGDGIHLNRLGNRLLAALIIPYLRYDPKLGASAEQEFVRDVPIESPKVKRRNDGSIEMEFTGNRIDAIAATIDCDQPGTAKVLIDGKAPSEYPELYAFTRSTKMYGHYWPAIRKMSSQAPLLVEDWVARVTKVDVPNKRFHFELVGSKTGPDGTGTNDAQFVSNSGRIVLGPQSWTLRATSFRTGEPTPVGYEVKWSVAPLFVDVYQRPPVDDKSREYTTTLAQGLANGRHTVRLVPHRDGPLSIAGFRIYRPPAE